MMTYPTFHAALCALVILSFGAGASGQTPDVSVEPRNIPEPTATPNPLEAGTVPAPTPQDPDNAVAEEELPVILDDMEELGDREFPEEPVVVPTRRVAVRDPEPEVEPEVVDEVVDEEIEDELVDPAWPAGPGYLGFYDFGMAPAFTLRPGAFEAPYPGVYAIGRRERTKQLGPIRFGGSITAGLSYTDNVFGTADDRSGDFVFTLAPVIFLEAGERGRVRLLYSPVYNQYFRNAGESRVDQTVLLSAEYPFHAFDVGTNFAYTTRSGLFAATEGFASLDTYAGDVYLRARLTNKTTGLIAYNFVLQHADPGDTQYDNSVLLSLSYQFTRKIHAGVFVQPGVTFLPGESQPYIIGGVSAGYQASRRLRAYGRAGVEFRNLGGEGLVTPVLLGGVAWNPFDALQLNAQVFRTVTNNPFEAGETTIGTGGSLSASLVMWRRWTLGAFGSLAYVEEREDSGDVDREYLYGTAGASLSYAITRDWSCSVYYNYAFRGSVSNISGFDRNVVGVAVTWQF